MKGCEYALAKLFGVPASEDGPELRLTQKDGLHGCFTVDRDVGQHAEFFQRPERQVLHLIDNQNATASRPNPTKLG